MTTALFSSGRSAKNVAWNLLGGVWAGVLVIVATPWYVTRLGFDGYGVLGLWLVMQVMTGLLDLGMGATVVREFADARRHNTLEFKRDLLRTVEVAYWAVAVLLSLVLLSTSGCIAREWLRSDTLPSQSVGAALRLMAIALGFQFPSAIYLNGLAGLQEQGWMNALQMIGNGLRYGIGAAVLLWRADLRWFFAAQIGVAVLQTMATRIVLWRMIQEPSARSPLFRTDLLRRLWRYSMGMALTSIAAVLLANADRIALSKMASTAELGKYAVAFTATGLLQMGIQPFYRAFFPRYSELVSSGAAKQLRDEYFRSCRLMAVALIPMGILGVAFAPQIFLAWIGKEDETVTASFRWLLVGITCSGLMWLPAAFQQAHGWTRLHAGMIAGALLAGSPAMVWAIKAYGAVGAATVWVIHGVSGITLELWLLHRRLLTGELLSWCSSVLLQPLAISLPLVGLSWWLMPQHLSKWTGLVWVGVTGAIAIASALFFSLGGRPVGSEVPGR